MLEKFFGECATLQNEKYSIVRIDLKRCLLLNRNHKVFFNYGCFALLEALCRVRIKHYYLSYSVLIFNRGTAKNKIFCYSIESFSLTFEITKNVGEYNTDCS